MMSFRDIWNAIEGYTQARKDEYAVMWDISQYNASRTASHKEQLNAIKKDKNPYVTKGIKAKSDKPFSMDDIVPFFRSLTGKT